MYSCSSCSTAQADLGSVDVADKVESTTKSEDCSKSSSITYGSHIMRRLVKPKQNALVYNSWALLMLSSRRIRIRLCSGVACWSATIASRKKKETITDPRKTPRRAELL